MKPHEQLGIAIAFAGYTWTPEMRSSWEEVDKQITKYEQVLRSIANEHIELSHDKIKWQCEDHVRWAKEALK